MKKWNKEKTKILNETFVGNWHKEANEKNENIFMAMSMDENGKAMTYMWNIDKDTLCKYLRACANELENNKLIKEYKFPIN